MSDYSFMRTGRNIQPQNTPIDPDRIMGMITLFIRNGMTNAAKYVEYCQRNGVTQEDVVYGLIYEVFEFLNDPNLSANIEQSIGEINETDEEDDDLDDIIVPDEQIQGFSRITDELINADNEVFVNKMHNYYDNWEDWEPQDEIQIILKNAINQSINSIRDGEDELDDNMDVEYD